MSVLPFLGVAFGFGAASLLTRRRSGLSFAIGVIGLGAAAVAALTIAPGDTLAIGGGTIAGSGYQRVFLALACASSAILSLISLTGGWQPNLAGASLVAFGAGGAALALDDPVAAITATIVAGLVGVLVTVSVPVTARAVNVGVRELRAVAIAGVLGLLAAAWVDRPLGPLAAEPVVFGLSYLAIAIGVAFRFGAIPFHVWAARVADAAPELALPLLMAWGPAVFAIVGLAWVNGAIAPLAPVPLLLPFERALVIGIAVATMLLGAFAAWIQDDVEHVVGYSIVQDAAFAILAFAALDTASWAPAVTWILVFVLAKTAFAAWALAIRRRFGTRRLRELRGWARRTPLLALALVLIAVATIGWPGLTSYEARIGLIRLTSDGPFRWLLTFGAVAAVAYYARLLAIGLGTPGAAAAAAVSERPHWPEPSISVAGEPPQSGGTPRSPAASRPADVRVAPERSERPRPSRRSDSWPDRARVWLDRGHIWVDRASDSLTQARRRAEPALRGLGRGSKRVGAAGIRLGQSSPRLIGPVIALNQAFIAAALVLVLSAMALVAAFGGWGIGSAIAAGSGLGPSALQVP